MVSVLRFEVAKSSRFSANSWSIGKSRWKERNKPLVSSPRR